MYRYDGCRSRELDPDAGTLDELQPCKGQLSLQRRGAINLHIAYKQLYSLSLSTQLSAIIDTGQREAKGKL